MFVNIIYPQNKDDLVLFKCEKCGSYQYIKQDYAYGRCNCNELTFPVYMKLCKYKVEVCKNPK